MNDPVIFAALTTNRCPDCGGTDWRLGPRDGLVRDVECRTCKARFNMTGCEGALLWAQRIPKEIDGGPTWSDAVIAKTANIEATVNKLAVAITMRLAQVSKDDLDYVFYSLLTEHAKGVLLDWALGRNPNLSATTPYWISDDGKSITCLCCGATSHNANDVAKKYCANCHTFHEA